MSSPKEARCSSRSNIAKGRPLHRPRAKMSVLAVSDLLDRRGIEYRVIAPQETMQNIVATFAAGKPGRHLALNGHIDVFPVGDGEGWTQD